MGAVPLGQGQDRGREPDRKGVHLHRVPAVRDPALRERRAAEHAQPGRGHRGGDRGPRRVLGPVRLRREHARQLEQPPHQARRHRAHQQVQQHQLHEGVPVGGQAQERGRGRARAAEVEGERGLRLEGRPGRLEPSQGDAREAGGDRGRNRGRDRGHSGREAGRQQDADLRGHERQQHVGDQLQRRHLLRVGVQPGRQDHGPERHLRAGHQQAAELPAEQRRGRERQSGRHRPVPQERKRLAEALPVEPLGLPVRKAREHEQLPELLEGGRHRVGRARPAKREAGTARGGEGVQPQNKEDLPGPERRGFEGRLLRRGRPGGAVRHRREQPGAEGRPAEDPVPVGGGLHGDPAREEPGQQGGRLEEERGALLFLPDRPGEREGRLEHPNPLPAEVAGVREEGGDRPREAEEGEHAHPGRGEGARGGLGPGGGPGPGAHHEQGQGQPVFHEQQGVLEEPGGGAEASARREHLEDQGPAHPRGRHRGVRLQQHEHLLRDARRRGFAGGHLRQANEEEAGGGGRPDCGGRAARRQRPGAFEPGD